MFSVFNGWRRKTGVVTLLVACAVMVLWIRSRAITEDFFLPLGRQTTLQFISRQSTLTVRKFAAPVRVGTANVGPDRLLLFGFFPPTNTSDGDVAFSADEENRAQLGTPYVWRFRTSGVGLAAFRDQELSLRVDIFTIPYWLIALPPTFLSATLLLWPRRKK